MSRLQVARLLAIMAFALLGELAHGADMNKTVRFALRAAETGFDPVRESDRYSATVLETIYDSPLTYDYLARPVKLIPNITEGMPEVSDSGATYVIKLRKGIYFTPHEAFKGKKREVVAQDLNYSIRRFFDPIYRSPWLFLFEGKIAGADDVMEQAKKSGSYNYEASIAGLELLDRYTLRIRLKEPDYNFLYYLAMPCLGIAAREVVDYYGWDEFRSHPVGTGPFVLKQWVRSSKIVLEANPDYRDDYLNATPEDTPEDRKIIENLKGKKLPLIGRIELYPIDEPQPRWLAFLNKEHDHLWWLPEEFGNTVVPNGKLAPNLTKMGIQYILLPEQDLTFTYFNMNDPVIGGYTMEKIALRRAMNLAYNNDEEKLLARKSLAVIAQSPVPPGAGGFDSNFKSTAAEHSIPKAKALLDMFGYKDIDGDGYRELPDGSPLSLEMASPPDASYNTVLDPLWKKAADSIGIRLTFLKEKWPDLVKKGHASKIQVGNYISWHADYPDGENFFQLLYGPNSGQANYSNFNLPAFNKMYEQSKRMPDSPERTKLYQEMTKLSIAYAPWGIHMHRIQVHTAQPWISNWKVHPIMHQPWLYLDVDVEQQRKAREN
jgi:oligopeptide transport system substrate-binding protein